MKVKRSKRRSQIRSRKTRLNVDCGANQHVPNKKTIAALKASEKGKDIEKIEDLKEFWKSIGL